MRAQAAGIGISPTRPTTQRSCFNWPSLGTTEKVPSMWMALALDKVLAPASDKNMMIPLSTY